MALGQDSTKWLRLHLGMQGVQGLIPGWGGKIAYASWPKNQDIKKSKGNIVTNSIKTLKNGPDFKEIFKTERKKERLTSCQRKKKVHLEEVHKAKSDNGSIKKNNSSSE